MKERAPHSLARCPKLGISALKKEVADLYLPFCEEDDQLKARDVSELPKPFAAFGSLRQRHGEVLEHNHARTIEAPANLESAACLPRGGLSQEVSHHYCDNNGCLDTVSIECDQFAASQTFKLPHPFRKSHKSFSTDLDREEAWERKKEQYLFEEEDEDSNSGEEYDADEGLYDGVCDKGIADEGSPGSDGGMSYDNAKDNVKRILEHGEGSTDGVYLDVAHTDKEHLNALHKDGIKKASKMMPFSKKKSFTRRSSKPLIRTRTRSLTDEDMEELRGSIDLGFGFRFSEQCNLKSTLPALELYYAINKNYVDAQSRSSPVSPLDVNALVRTNSAGSTSCPSSETWRIASPGDHPSQVKTRLRHWAQAVACSVKQGY